MQYFDVFMVQTTIFITVILSNLIPPVDSAYFPAQALKRILLTVLGAFLLSEFYYRCISLYCKFTLIK